MLNPPDTAWQGKTFFDPAKLASLLSSLAGHGVVEAALAEAFLRLYEQIREGGRVAE